jgi:transposase-like protein
MFYLTPQQIQVADALSNGASLTGAAAEAGIHRNTIANWRRESRGFRDALAHAHYFRATLYRDRAIELADLAFEALRKVLTNPESSPSALLRAATFIIGKVATPPPPEKEKPVSMVDLLAAPVSMVDLLAANEEFDPARFSPRPPDEAAKDAQECTTGSIRGTRLRACALLR